MNEPLGEIATLVTIARICSVFDRKSWKYERSGTQIRSGFEEKPIFINYSEEDGRIDFSSDIVDGVSDLESGDVLGFIEDWHRRCTIPKAYMFNTEDGGTVIRLERAVLFTDGKRVPVGATDAQLELCVEQFIYAALAFHKEFTEAFGEES